MIGQEELDLLRPGAFLINVSRAEIVQEEPLYRALEEGRLGGAALDVFQMEPPAAGEPLLSFDNVIATPHIGGSTEEAQEIVGIRIVEQLIVEET